MNRLHTQRLAMLFTLLLPSLALAALGERYEGQGVSASFDTLASSVTGVLTIGDERYLLEAQEVKGSYQGVLYNMVSGKGAGLTLRGDSKRIELEIDADGAAPQRLELHAR